MKRAAASGALLGALGALGACSVVATFDEDDRPSRDGGSATGDASTRADGTTSGDDARTEPGVYPNGCVGHAGPEPIKAAGYCIDSTEVTNAQYAQFVDGTGGGKPGTQAAACASNASFVPGGSWPVDGARANFPVVHVDWCDAYAFCAWAGKRLCGKIGGGPTPPAETATVVDQWFLACAMGGTRMYPYAGAYGDDTCNGKDHNLDRAVAVASMPTCEGGFSGLFDMSGNVLEWQDSCNASGGDAAADSCLVRGGGFDSDEGELRCAALSLEARSAKDSEIGFRCCSP